MNDSKDYPFLRGGGEIPKLIKEYDWSKNVLGSPGGWPQSLCTTLGILLHSAFPMFLFWGKELICFYNDAFRPSLGIEGKHPAIGKTGEQVWPEIWEFIGPLIEKVMTKGEAIWFEDQLVPFFRNGHMEDIYWTFSYSPVYGDKGSIYGVVVTCTETTEKVNNLFQLKESRDFLHFAVEAAELGIWDYYPQTATFSANRRLKDWFGLPPGPDAELTDALQRIPDGERQLVAAAIQEALQYESGGNYDIEYTIIHPETKKERIVLAKGKVWFNEEKIAYRLNGTLQDITERKKAENAVKASDLRARQKIEDVVAQRTGALQQANASLKRSNEDLAQFAYIASHDLQEPLRKVSTYSQLLEESLGEISNRSRNYLEKINSSTKRMVSLIRDVLAYSQLAKTGNVFHETDLTKVLETVLNDFELLIEQKKAHIMYQPLPKMEALHLQISQLFSNLISNALKFSKADTPLQLNITLAHLSPEEIAGHNLPPGNIPFYHIRFADNGIGFSQDYAEQIFNIFQRLHGQKEYEGTGIGLALCRKIVENHHGLIYAEGIPGKGAVFNVLLPAVVNKTAVAGQQEQGSGPDPAGRA